MTIGSPIAIVIWLWLVEPRAEDISIITTAVAAAICTGIQEQESIPVKTG